MSIIEEIKEGLADIPKMSAHHRGVFNAAAPHWLEALIDYFEAAEEALLSCEFIATDKDVEKLEAARNKLNG